MVSQITTGFPTDDHGRPFRRRRYIPFAIVTVLLLVVGVIIWASALAEGDSSSATTACNEPPAPSAASSAAPAPTAPASVAPRSTVQSADLIGVAPGALSTFQVRVLNASAQRGQARTVLDDLTSQGFTPATDTPYADDTVYYDQNLDCVGQIRFGQASRAAAAALWLAEPCAQLIDDGRSGQVVDLVLGTQFSSKEQSQDAQAALEALRSADPKNAKTGADPALVRAVHNSAC